MHHGDVSPEIAKGLLEIRKRIDVSKIPPSQLDQSINIAVWNIREFGRVRRTQAAVHYIAEILGSFDLIALVELRDNLEDLGRVMWFLGPYWDIVYSDWVDDRGGNNERTGFLFDRRAVTFNGLAAEIDPPRSKVGTEYLSLFSFWRPPYMCSFRAGNFDFIAIATHTRWGDTEEARKAELKLMADWIDSRFTHKFVEDHDLIVMGDFNIPKMGDELFKALTARGLVVPDCLKELKAGDRVIGGSNLGMDARYDQILHLPTMKERFTDNGGALDFFVNDAHIKKLFPKNKYTRQQFTYQMSDHFPVWAQIMTDIDGQRLSQIVQNAKKS